jgi:adenine-specific DNA-methyltransferase
MSGWPTSPKNWRLMRPLGRELRKAPTPAEKALWQAIRKKKVAGARFQRQRSFERYLPDFYCPEVKLAIEVDGPIHDQQQDADAFRQLYLEDVGLYVLRFRNDDVLKRLPAVLTAIAQAVVELRATLARTTPQGEDTD